jgi:hypothetical protein
MLIGASDRVDLAVPMNNVDPAPAHGIPDSIHPSTSRCARDSAAAA